MSSVRTGGRVRCQCCGEAFVRLSSHLNWKAGCSAFYDSLPKVLPNNVVVDDMHIPADAAYFDKEGDTAGAGHSRKSSRRASRVDPPIDDYNDEGYDEDFGMMSDGDDFGMMSDGDVSAVRSSNEESEDEGEDEGEDEEIPDGIIMDLYKEMQELRSNPLGLDRFSVEEKVHIELLHLLKELNAPLKAFSVILNWAAKANRQGHIFEPECQPCRRRVIHTLYCRYNMKGLIPKEKLFYLPYSRRIVPMMIHCVNNRLVFTKLRCHRRHHCHFRNCLLGTPSYGFVTTNAYV